MLVNPPVGFITQIWYAKEKVGFMTPHHGKFCVVVIPIRSRPRNHIVVTVGGDDYFPEMISVPCGNLRKPPPTAAG